MENSIITSVKQVEQQCEELKSKALLEKNNIIKDAEEKVKQMEFDFQNSMKEKKQQLFEETKIKNENALKVEVENAKEEIARIQSMISDKEQGAISLVMSLIA